MKNVLILGEGYISSKIKKYWNNDAKLFTVSRKDHDYLTEDGFKEIIEIVKPSFVINTYGFTGKPNVDSCEDHANECFKRNCGDAIELCHMLDIKRLNIPFITISTGCVYNDDTGLIEFTEDMIGNFGLSNPTSSIYSKSKSNFENMFRGFLKYDTKYTSVSSKRYMLRIRMPFDDVMDDKNYINKILKYDKLVNYKNSVTYVKDLVRFIEIIVQGGVDSGIYNVVNKDPITAEDVIGIYNEITGEEKSIDRWYSTDDLLSMGLMKCRRSNCVLSTDKVSEYYPDLMTSYDAVKESLKIWNDRGGI